MANEKVELIEDFSGGLNTRDAPNRIGPTFTPTATNVWYDSQSLKKRNGATVASTVATIFGSNTVEWRGVQVRNYATGVSAVDGLLIIANIGQAKNVAIFTTNSTSFTCVARTNAGTVSTTAGSATVTGSGTPFTEYRAGDYLAIGTPPEYLEIATTPVSDTSLTATTNAVNTVAGASFRAFPTWTATNRVAFSDMNSLLWVSARGSTTATWNGSTMVPNNAFPAAPYSVVYKNYVFAGGTAANPSRLSWCALKDPTSWPASNFIDVNPDDGFPMVGLFLDGQSIVILKTNGAYKLTGDVFDPSNPTYVLSKIYTPPEFLINSHRTVQLVQDGYIMLCSTGFYLYDGGNTISKLENADIARDQFSSIAGFSLQSLPNIAAEPSSIIVNGDYWVSVETSAFSHTSGYKNAIYVLDKKRALWRWNQNINAQISDFAYRGGALHGVNADTGASSGLQTLNTGTVDTGSNAINGTWTSKVFQYPNQQQFLYAHVYYKDQTAGNLTFEYSIDEGSFTSVAIDMTVGSVVRVKSNKILIGQVGSSIQFRLSNATASQTFEVYAIEYVRRDLRI